MSEYIEEAFIHNGYTVQLIADQDAQSPEEWDSDEMFVVTTRNRSFEVLRDGQDAKECMADKDLCKRYWIFPAYAHVHSGVALSLTPFSDLWDSAQIGFVFVSKSEWRYRTRKTKRSEGAQKAAESHLETWNMYLRGDVWGYVIETPDGEQVDSCWGCYGLEYAKERALECVPDAPAVAPETVESAQEVK